MLNLTKNRLGDGAVPHFADALATNRVRSTRLSHSHPDPLTDTGRSPSGKESNHSRRWSTAAGRLECKQGETHTLLSPSP